MENRTSLSFAHRLSTIAKLDRIIVLKNGRKLSRTDHTMNSSIKTRRLRKIMGRQSGGFIEE